MTRSKWLDNPRRKEHRNVIHQSSAYEAGAYDGWEECVEAVLAHEVVIGVKDIEDQSQCCYECTDRNLGWSQEPCNECLGKRTDEETYPLFKRNQL